VGPHHQTYLLTCDVPELLKSFEAIGLRTNAELALALDTRLHERLCRIFGDNVVVLPMCDLRQSIQQLLSSVHKNVNGIVVTNRLLHPHEATPCLEINRLVDESGETIGLGSRPWHDHPKEQIAKIAALYGQGPIVILEDGSWSGHTVAQLAMDFRAHGVEVSDIICGILFQKGHQCILESGYRGRIHFASYYPDDSCKDWMPDHDFFPFLPSSGKVLGKRSNDGHQPVRENSSSVSFPYIRPYGDPVSWASIPEGDAKWFSEECLADTIGFFEDMESINGVRITLEMVSRLYPRASCPQRLPNPRPIPPPLTAVLEVLHADMMHLRKEIR